MHYTDQSIEELTARLYSLYATKYAHTSDTSHPYALDIHHLTHLLGGTITTTLHLEPGSITTRITHPHHDPEPDAGATFTFTTTLSKTDPPRLQRFRLAHEIGHIYLHHLKPAPEHGKQSSTSTRPIRQKRNGAHRLTNLPVRYSCLHTNFIKHGMRQAATSSKSQSSSRSQ